jgi:hypothetical protein
MKRRKSMGQRRLCVLIPMHGREWGEKEREREEIE